MDIKSSSEVRSHSVEDEAGRPVETFQRKDVVEFETPTEGLGVEKPVESRQQPSMMESVKEKLGMQSKGEHIEGRRVDDPYAAGYGPESSQASTGSSLISTVKEKLGLQEAKSREKMHALVWRGKYDIRYELVDKPEIKHPSDALIRVTATSICGSDLHFYNGEFPKMKSGDVVGHEFMGIIEEKGSSVSLPQGQRVVVSFDIACGSCEYCLREEFTACDRTNPSNDMDKMYGHRSAGLFGYSHATGGYSGGQAEYVRVPFADVNCLPIPDSLPDNKALFLSDIIPTAFHACEMGQVKGGDTVGIWGLGPVGLLCAKWCQLLGASRIIGIEVSENRLALAKKSLGIEVINAREQKVVDVLKDMLPRGLDVAIDATGYRFAQGIGHQVQRALYMESDTPEVITQCVTALRKFGRLSIIADYLGTANNFPIGHIAMKHLYVASGQSPTQKNWKYCLSKLESGEFDPTILVTHELPLSEGPQAFKKFNEHEDGYVKVLLRPAPLSH